jgi:TonB family protein
MDMLSLGNLVALSMQIAGVVAAGAAGITLLRVGDAAARYAMWRGLLLVCVLLPFFAPRQPATTAEAVVVVSVLPAAMVEQSAAGSAAPVAGGGVIAVLIAAGGALRLAWLTVGLVHLRRLRRAGDPAGPDDYGELLAALAPHAEIRYIDALQQPVTFGLRQPVVLLPAALRQQAEATRVAIAAHELVHIRRRDWCWVMVEELLRTACWFHPALWWLISRVQQAREEVVDCTVVAITGRRREYLQALLAFADDTPLAPAPAFARRRHLFRRILLLSREDAMTTRRLVASAFVMMVIITAAAGAAVRAFPVHESDSGSTQWTIAELLQPAGPVEQSAKRVSVEKLVPNRVAGEQPAFPSVADSDTSAVVTLRVTLDQTGRVAELRLAAFSFRRGNVSGSVEGSGFNDFASKAQFRDPSGAVFTGESMRPVFEAFIESAAAAVSRWQFEPPSEGPLTFLTSAFFTNGMASTANAPAPARSAVNSEGALRVGGNVKAPVKIKHVAPVYPEDAKDARVQGVVIAEVRIEPDGRVSDAKVLRSIPMLDEAALAAIRQWEFNPPQLNGAPVPVVMVVTLQFTLKNQ